MILIIIVVADENVQYLVLKRQYRCTYQVESGLSKNRFTIPCYITITCSLTNWLSTIQFKNPFVCNVLVMGNLWNIKIHVRPHPILEKQITQVNHCNWMRKQSVQVGIIMTNFQKHTRSPKRTLNEKIFWTFVQVITFSWWKGNVATCLGLFWLLIIKVVFYFFDKYVSIWIFSIKAKQMLSYQQIWSLFRIFPFTLHMPPSLSTSNLDPRVCNLSILHCICKMYNNNRIGRTAVELLVI